MNTIDNPQQLIDAAKAGNIHKLQELLPRAYAREKNKALVEAAKNGHSKCVKMLLTQCKKEKENQRAFLKAFRNGHTQCVALLLPYYSGLEEDHLLLMEAAAKGQVDMVRILTPVSRQRTIDDALKAAALNGHYKCAKELVAKASRVKMSEALVRAALNGHLQLVELLIPLSDPQSNDSKALAYAVVGKHIQCVEVLLDVSDTKKVLEYFQQTFSRTPDEWMFFAEMVERWSQRTILRGITEKHSDANTASRSKKM